MLNEFTKARPNIFLTSFFRSGSTHIKESLLRILPGYRGETTVLSAGEIGNDNNGAISPFAAQLLFPKPAQIFHQHTPGTCGNAILLKMYKVRPVIQMRNMLDSMISVVELLRLGQPQHLGIYYPQNFHRWNEFDQLWWAVANLPNWYFTFYLSWKYADVDKLIIWYDEYYKDQVAGLKSIITHSQIEGTVTDEVLKMASEVIDPKLSRFKFGRPGRGREILNGAMVEDVIDQAKLWKEGRELIDNLVERGYD